MAKTTKKKSDKCFGNARFCEPSGLGKRSGREMFRFTFEEGLKLSMAIQACLLNLSRFNRKSARNLRVSLAFDLDGTAVDVNVYP